MIQKREEINCGCEGAENERGKEEGMRIRRKVQ